MKSTSQLSYDSACLICVQKSSCIWKMEVRQEEYLEDENRQHDDTACWINMKIVFSACQNRLLCCSFNCM